MKKKIKLGAILIFLAGLPFSAIVYSISVNRFGLLGIQSLLLLTVIAMCAVVLFSLLVEFAIGFTIKKFIKDIGREWEEKHTVAVLGSAPEELRDISSKYADILRSIERKGKVFKEAKKLEDLKYEFITIASHQLRTPLTEVKWAVDFLNNLKSVQKDKKIREVTEIADSAVSDMIDMTNQLLSVVQVSVDDTVLNTKPVNLEKIIKAAIKLSEPSAASRGIKIEVKQSSSLLPSVMGETELLRFVFHNLIVNAIHYGPTGKKILLDVSVHEEKVKVSVVNEGVTIAPAEQALVFERFFRGAKAKRIRPNGSGLALYLSKKIIERQGGTISFDTTSGNQTIFTVVLPVAAKGELEEFLTRH